MKSGEVQFGRMFAARSGAQRLNNCLGPHGLLFSQLRQWANSSSPDGVMANVNVNDGKEGAIG